MLRPKAVTDRVNVKQSSLALNIFYYLDRKGSATV
jgi:hypothetical protein